MADTYPLSTMQQGMLFHYRYEPNTGVDIAQLVCTLNESLDIGSFRQAWERVVARHDILRTSFNWDTCEQPMQQVAAQFTLPFSVTDWLAISETEQELQLKEFLQTDRRVGFTMTEAPMMRLVLFQLGTAKYKLVWTFHHALMDGRSILIVLKEVFAFYAAIGSGQDLFLPAPPNYREYIAWLQCQNPTASEAYWREQLHGFTVPTPLVVDHPARSMPAGESRLGECTQFLSTAVTSRLKDLAVSNGITLQTVIQGAWGLLLHRYSGEEDIVFGETRACRHSINRGDDMVGLFINTLPVRVKVNLSEPLLPWLYGLRTQWVAMRDHEHTPLVNVQGWSDVKAGRQLFESIVVFENYLLDTLLRAQGGVWLNREFCLHEQNNYPITLSAYAGDELCLKIEYDRQRFEDSTIGRMVGHYKTILEAIAADPNRRLGELPLLTVEERQQILVEWNNTRRDYPTNVLLHELFEAQAARTPDAVAVVFQNQQLTYRELDNRANYLACQLGSAGVGPNQLVGIYVERSLEMVIGLLGILKAGGAYVPMDPAFPAERLGFMVEDAKMPVIVTQESLIAALPSHRAKVIALDVPTDHLSDIESAIRKPTSADLAYVIFTSGSTGRPKGVQIPHRAIVNLLNSMRREPGLTSQDVMLSVTTLSFDIAALDLFLPLTTGATAAIVSREKSFDGSLLKRELERVNATVMQATPVTWRLLLEAGWRGNPKLKILVGGEAVPRELVNQLVPLCGSLWNCYGPTETTIWSTTTRLEEGTGSVSIGRPIDNTSVYIVNADMQLQPVGVSGELLIGGAGLANGYLDRPELSAEKFIPNQFAAMDSLARLYRTGDLAKWRQDGMIECLGRIDHQVKLRGFRIELGEIEAVLDSHPSVRKSAVIAREDPRGEKRLLAYYVVESGKETGIGDMRRFLEQKLPYYMVPSILVILPELPLTPNRKIDRKALPEPDHERPDLGSEYVAPRTDTERELCRIWSDLLKVENISIFDNFFDLGGHSLMVLRAISSINNIFKSDLAPVVLFEHPTVAKLSPFFEAKNPELEKAAVSLSENPEKKELLERAKDDLALIAAVVAHRSDRSSLVGAGRPYRMRESWICRQLLAPLYRIKRKSFRSLLQRLILKLEGGEGFTVTLRKLYAEYHNLDIGDYSTGVFDVSRMQPKTKIGRYTSIYPTVVFQNADHPRNTISTHALFYHPAFRFAGGYELPRVELQVGNDVWIGHNAMILYPTKKIGDGAVIAAGSFVVEDVPPYAIVGGYPARILRYRFSKEKIEELLKSRWWEASLEELEPVKGHFAHPLEGDKIR
jgi:amino acid adenylation domain-containing protein